MKLNLGCGDKILEGYVNVDVAESRAGRQPDVLCDLHHLKPCDANVADEFCPCMWSNISGAGKS